MQKEFLTWVLDREQYEKIFDFIIFAVRVLIISPHFPPTNAPDMQRVRLLLPHFAGAEIEAEVLAVDPWQVAAPEDSWLVEGLPGDVPVHRVQALGLRWRKLPGLGTLNFRALAAIRKKGNELLDGGSFDLVYFSTTQFGIHALGPEWKQKFGVPFVMDYQDPWVSDYYWEHPEIVPPGGRLKHAVASWFARRQEPQVLRECSGITSVSAAYPTQLAKRYPWLDVQVAGDREHETSSRFPISDLRPLSPGFRSQPSDLHSLPSLTLPFPGDALDLERVGESRIRQTVFDPLDGLIHWVYVGRGGEDMALASRSIFAALALLRSLPTGSRSFFCDLRLHFIGTSYAGAGRGVKTIEPLAKEYGLQGMVVEHADRIPYSETLRCLLDADALIVPGSDDPSYTASKIYPYMLAGKPLLAVFHENSSVIRVLRQAGGGTVVAFATGEMPESIAKRIIEEAFDSEGNLKQVALNPVAFEPHTASSQVMELASFFQHCLKSSEPRTRADQ